MDRGFNIPWIGGSICSNNISGLYIIQAQVMFQHFGWHSDNDNVRGGKYYVRTLNIISYCIIPLVLPTLFLRKPNISLNAGTVRRNGRNDFFQE